MKDDIYRSLSTPIFLFFTLMSYFFLSSIDAPDETKILIENLKSQGWVNAAVSDRGWDNEVLLVQEYSDTNPLLVEKSALTGGFSDEGKLVASVEFLVTGNLSACTESFQAYALLLVMRASSRITL